MPAQSQKITGEIKISETSFKEIQNIKGVADHRSKIEQYLDAAITDLLEIILGGAIALRASDLHLEPEEEKVKIRVRVDGILQEVIFIESEIYRRILSRIKLLSGLKLNITDRPQNGRFSIAIEKIDIEIRVSALPAEKGETLVLRILDPRALMQLEALGLRKDLLTIVNKEIKRPHGMVVATGPTGSGKSTTLYAFCQKIKNPTIKIITIEDPIEYHLEGISQTQVSPRRVYDFSSDSKTGLSVKRAYDFASGLKSIMRQDPDVILVGEMRDEETVKTALQAALTGHLVLTTLHTNDAAGVVARLVSLGGKLANIGPALNMVIAQRLVRKVCSQCKKLEKLSSENFKKITKELGSLAQKIEMPKLSKNLKIAKPVGCPACNQTGYQGRIGIFEIFLVHEEIEKFILEQSSIAALKNLIIKRGMTTVKQDGFIKVVQGITTIEEVERVVGE